MERWARAVLGELVLGRCDMSLIGTFREDRIYEEKIGDVACTRVREAHRWVGACTSVSVDVCAHVSLCVGVCAHTLIEQARAGFPGTQVTGRAPRG